ncbi:MAG: PEP-utilizing enzyme, partial [Candidatus Eiseniibacteriota bacterium]
AGRGRGLTREPVEASRQDAPSVTESELAELCAVALRIEKYMKCAQDIEWAVDAGGRIVILQVRPLRISEAAVPDDLDLSGIEIRHRILLRKRGVVACRGIGAGRVHIVAEEAPLDSIPEDVVLVARTPSPRLAGAVATARAVITDIGSATGHLAAVAREFRVPTIVETGGATQELAGAGEVTVDAESNLVYEGLVPELLRYQLLRRSSYEDTREFILLRKMLAKIAPLNLRDPQSPDFSPARCRTYHDIIRLAHEIAVNELVQGFRISPARSAAARPLTLDIPLDLVIVDLGGGMRGGLAAVPATLDDLRSIPLCALLDGLTAEGVWGTAPAAMDLNGFMSSATRSAVLTGPLVDAPQQNLAIVSERYLNLNLKLGYHFNIVECHASENRDDNFIYFRFGGGVTEMARRSRRADLLKRILRRFDFVVEGRQDLVIGRAKKMSLDDALERMRMIGRLIGFTRQLDIFLRDDAIVEHLVEDFIHGRIDATGR